MKKENLELNAATLEKEIIDVLTHHASKPGGERSGPGCNLRHGSACVLATCHDNLPRATPVDFFCDGTLAVWINADPGGKIANIMRNPRVAVGVYEPVDHSLEQKSLQIWGTAEIINRKNSPEVFQSRLESFGIMEAGQGMIEEMAQRGIVPAESVDAVFKKVVTQINLIKISPTKVVLLHMLPGGIPQRKIWDNGRATLQQSAP